jgi:hypothetical protein
MISVIDLCYDLHNIKKNFFRLGCRHIYSGRRNCGATFLFRRARGCLRGGGDQPGPAAEGNAREVTVEVNDEYHQRVLTITVLMDVDRVEPPPQPRARED